MNEPAQPEQSQEEAAARFVGWLEDRVLKAGRGDDLSSLNVDPDGKFWFGRLAPEARVMTSSLGERGERLDPCAIGIRCRPLAAAETVPFQAIVSFSIWSKADKGTWTKAGPINVEVPITYAPNAGGYGAAATFGAELIRSAVSERIGTDVHRAEIRVEEEYIDGRRALSVLLVNTSPDRHNRLDTNLYECKLRLVGLQAEPFLLAALPDSFRYDRRIDAYGINVGVVHGADGSFSTVDAPSLSRRRPVYWSVEGVEPDIRFATLASDPLPSLNNLARSLEKWGNDHWGEAALDARRIAEKWSSRMVEEAQQAAARFYEELERLKDGIRLLAENSVLCSAFMAMNKAMEISARGSYEGWRSFQIGFQLLSLRSIVDPAAASVVDVVWFATGGGKTETYLGHILTAAFWDRLTGKGSGITAWSRFPLRMLSLQQTQRFANALAAGELVRRQMEIPGDPFSLGFFVGQGATPNTIKPDPKDDEFDPDDEEAPRRYQVLARCPFCREKSIDMAFDRLLWKLEHRCTNPSCTWPETALPFYIVDDEIYRFLPTVVVGTLDKAASISMQASMRGFVGAPRGRCSVPGHGYVYAIRSTRPIGCLVPGCPGKAVQPLGMPDERFPPSFRLQDELHLLRDSLGAVDAHYEALYDGLQQEISGTTPKILASSATLSGYEKQVRVLYGRDGRVFPQPGPSAGAGFWTSDSARLMRRYVAVAPRGLTTEYMVDRMLTEMQSAVRELLDDPARICHAAGIEERHADLILSLYGTQVVYGNTLRDLDAVQRSVMSQVQVSGELNSGSLTGRDQFEDIRKTLERLEVPEETFKDRLHVVTASAMMSHGVDIDRLNVMIMIGLPLTTAEFIQATSRVGRKWPGLVFVVHKIGRERDAGVYRSFEKFVEQGDRFVEPIPITKRSRRVLECTLAGLEFARVLMIAEPASGQALTTLARFRDFVRANGIDLDREAQAIMESLQLHEPIDEPMREAINRWFEDFAQNIVNPPPNAKWPSDLSPTGGPMFSLRDVEQQVPVSGTRL